MQGAENSENTGLFAMPRQNAFGNGLRKSNLAFVWTDYDRKGIGWFRNNGSLFAKQSMN
jgi:hypothetical protein